MSGFGPWAPAIDQAEQLARYRELRALALVYVGTDHPFFAALAAAVAGEGSGEAAAARAIEELDRLPSLRRRRLLSAAAALWAPNRGRRG